MAKTSRGKSTRATWPPDDIEWDPRYRQCSREMVASILYWLAYAGSVLGVAWWLGYGKAASDVQFVVGVPAWVFWPAVVSLLFCTLVPAILVKGVFRNFPLAEPPNQTESKPPPERTDGTADR